MNFTVTVKMEFAPTGDNETAGLALVQNNNFQYRFEYSITEGQRVIRLVKCVSDTELDFEKRTFKYKNIETKLAEEPFNSDIIYLKVSANGQDYNFSYGESLEDMEILLANVDGRILNPDTAGGFVWTYIGMFASSNGKTSDNYADFDWFEYEGEKNGKK